VLPLGAQSGMTTEGSSWAGHDTSRFSVYECLAAVAPLPFSPLLTRCDESAGVWYHAPAFSCAYNVQGAGCERSMVG